MPDQPENRCRICGRPIAAGHKYCGQSDCCPNRDPSWNKTQATNQATKPDDPPMPEEAKPIKWKEFL
jgi:hypothetical protein